MVDVNGEEVLYVLVLLAASSAFYSCTVREAFKMSLADNPEQALKEFAKQKVETYKDDPHFSNKSYDEVEWTWGGEADSDGMFLRRVGGNGGSSLCRTCHGK